MASQPVLYATTPYSDDARRLVAPGLLVRGQEHGLLPRALPALELGNLDLDMCDVEQIDAAGLGMLAVLHALAARKGHILRLMNPRPRVWRLLCLSRLGGTFTPEDDILAVEDDGTETL